MKNEIPLMTDPMGKYWKQPPRSVILLDDKHAVMSQATFDALADYSGSQPTGAYEGKMWKRKFRERGSFVWLLCWFGESDQPDMVSVNSRDILLA